jgi:hypothetical protein
LLVLLRVWKVLSIGRETAGTTTLGRQGVAQGGFVLRAEPGIVEVGGESGDEEAGQGRARRRIARGLFLLVQAALVFGGSLLVLGGN